MRLKIFLHFLILAAACTVLMMTSSVLLAADPPQIAVSPVWRPASTLDSIDAGVLNTLDGGDDFRYVDAEIFVTASVQFWVAQLSCTVTPAVLTSYDSEATDGDPNNFVEPVIWGPRWGLLDQDFIQVVEPYNATTGKRTFTATRLGNISPMGNNGFNDTFLLATVRYRARDLAANGTSPLNCTADFLNRNGTPVLKAKYTAPAPLSVITGYSISGKVMYQGRATHAGINVQCDGPDGDTNPDFSIVTAAAGTFSTSALRNQGYFDCMFFGNITNPASGYQPDLYLGARTWFNLSGLSYTILPITLLGGNLSRDDVDTDGDPGTTDEVISAQDIGIITAPANWTRPVTAGDINGDNRTDRADLALAAGNFNSWELNESRHVLYSIPRSWEYWMNSRIWVGAPWAGPVTQMEPNPPADGRDHWGTLSPDGKTLAFTRDFGGNSSSGIGLFTAPVNNGVVGTPVRITPANAWYSAWAPSWSPDGTRIAFVCSWYDNGEDTSDGNDYASGYLADMGNLCVIDANGRNFQNTAWQSRARIYPPAWLSNTELVYGGSWTLVDYNANPICPDTLCYFNLQTEENRAFDNDVLAGSAGNPVADMPVIRDGVLFYRFHDVNNATRVIRWAEIVNGEVDPFEARTGSNAPYHMVMDFNDGNDYLPMSEDVDYFNISRNGWDVIFYTTGGYDFSKSWFRDGSLSGPTPVEWNSPFTNWVDDMVGNPNGPATPYTHDDPTDGSPLYAHRNTVDWVP